MASISIPASHRFPTRAVALLGLLAGACALSRTAGDAGETPDAGVDAGAVDAGLDAGSERCEGDADCADDRFCTGARYCDPAEGVCRDGRVPDCGRLLCPGATCDAAADACVAPDGDADGDPLLGCGAGGDCDDGDDAVSSRHPERCASGVDDDCDGLRDCTDPDCAADPACADCGRVDVETACDDGLDDDCDGLFDAEDPDCCVPLPGGEVCMNGVDGDCDGLLVCEDPDCADEPDCR